MPIFLDRHDMVEQSAEETAMLHLKDLEIQDQYGVKFLTYWYDAERRTTFCLVDAPNKETADKVHAEAHGYVANEMFEVDLSAVEACLGRIQDPLGSAPFLGHPSPPLSNVCFIRLYATPPPKKGTLLISAPYGVKGDTPLFLPASATPANR